MLRRVDVTLSISWCQLLPSLQPVFQHLSLSYVYTSLLILALDEKDHPRCCTPLKSHVEKENDDDEAESITCIRLH